MSARFAAALDWLTMKPHLVRMPRVLVFAGTVLAALGVVTGTAAQTPSAAQRAPYDLTGTWVSVVTEDWRWRMLTPPRGDYASVPMTPAARAMADQWDPAADVLAGNECRPYGAGGIMRIPGRLRISWADENTLRLEADAGQQTRLFHFGEFEAEPAPTWQGNSKADWEMVGARRGSPPTGGNLKVQTTGMKSGYLRWNGVPYSEQAVITEFFDRYAAFGQEWFTVTTVIEDPIYLSEPFILSTDFRKEADDSGWNPTPCLTDPPVVDN